MRFAWKNAAFALMIASLSALATEEHLFANVHVEAAIRFVAAIGIFFLRPFKPEN